MNPRTDCHVDLVEPGPVDEEALESAEVVPAHWARVPGRRKKPVGPGRTEGSSRDESDE